MNENGINPYYELRAPGPQTVVDLFKNSWKSELPGGLTSGSAPMFEDSRPAWLASQLPGGLALKTVLELGPFEGYQTYQLLRNGAKEVTSIEANSINYLKCLCIKELYGLQAKILFGDIVKFVRDCDRRFDIVWASGVLYHLQDPAYLIQRVSQLAHYVYVWTHYFDASVIGELNNGQERHFIPELDKVEHHHGRDIRLHARSYLLPNYKSAIPMYWEGGLDQVAFWLEKEDIFWLFQHAGMRVLAVQGESTEVSGLPSIGFLVARSELL